MFLYQIINNINGKRYISITSNVIQRFKYHRRNRVESSKEYNKVLYCAFRKYGIDNFTFDILYDDLSIQDAKELEIKLIKEFNTLSHNNGYNVTEGGDRNISCGERNRNSTLTEIQAKEIISRRESGETKSSIYKDFPQLKPSGFESIWLGYSWKHIQPNKISKLHGGSKLSNNDLTEIIKLLEENVSYPKIAKIFGVSTALICNIKNGKSYTKYLVGSV